MFNGLYSLERLNLRTAAGKAKIAGTLIGIGGAMVLTFVKGKEIKIGTFDFNLLHQNGARPPAQASGGKTVLGSLSALASGVSYALWLIIQAKMIERYPCPYSSTALMSMWGALVSIVIALCLERDWTQWRLGWNIRLWTAAYSVCHFLTNPFITLYIAYSSFLFFYQNKDKRSICVLTSYIKWNIPYQYLLLSSLRSHLFSLMYLQRYSNVQVR